MDLEEGLDLDAAPPKRAWSSSRSGSERAAPRGGFRVSTKLDSRLCFAKSRGRSDGMPTVERFDMLIVVVQAKKDFLIRVFFDV
jgi:hypothetical protein